MLMHIISHPRRSVVVLRETRRMSSLIDHRIRFSFLSLLSHWISMGLEFRCPLNPNALGLALVALLRRLPVLLLLPRWTRLMMLHYHHIIVHPTSMHRRPLLILKWILINRRYMPCILGQWRLPIYRCGVLTERQRHSSIVSRLGKGYCSLGAWSLPHFL